MRNWPTDRKRKTMVIVAALLVAGPLAAQTNLENRVAYATTSVRLRGGPSTEHTILALLSSGSAVRVYECEGGWCRVRSAETRDVGYVSAQFLRAGKAPQPTSQTPTSTSGCQRPSARAIEDIRSVLDIVGSYRIRRTAAVLSTDHANAHLVALTFTASGIEEPQVLVFLVSGSINSPSGMYFAGDAMTESFSVVPRAKDTRAGMVRGTASYRRVVACVGG